MIHRIKRRINSCLAWAGVISIWLFIGGITAISIALVMPLVLGVK